MKMITKFLRLSWVRSISKINLIVLIFFLLIVSCKKDDKEKLISDTGLCLVEVDGIFEELKLDDKPEYLNGGDEVFKKEIGENSRYPPEARENEIEGLCVINYEITEEGKVENIEVIQDPGGGIGNSSVETIELVTEGVSFSPGILNGNPVRVKKDLEMIYKLE